MWCGASDSPGVGTDSIVCKDEMVPEDIHRPNTTAMTDRYILSLPVLLFIVTPLFGLAQDGNSRPEHQRQASDHLPAAQDERTGERTILFYCIPEYSTGSVEGDHIANVTLGTINHTSGASAAPFYSDFSFQGPEMTTRITAYGSHALSITAGTFEPTGAEFSAFSAWIDYDQNGTFETSEQLGYFQTTAAGETGSITFSVPTGVPDGYTTLRVRTAFNIASMDPCAPYIYGETEDYTVLVERSTCIPLLSYGAQYGDFLGEVSVGDFTYTPVVVPPSSPYTDRFDLGTQFQRGGTYPVTITSGTFTGISWLGVWADWNMDGDWDDADELVGLASVTGADQSTSFTLNVPTTMYAGYLKLRVRNIFSGASATACSDQSHGETLDFTLSVVDGMYPCLPIQGNGTVFGDGFEEVDFEGQTSFGTNFWPFHGSTGHSYHFDPGDLLSMSITNGAYPDQRFEVYLDMNNNGSLTDVGELLGFAEATSAGQVVVLSFAIPTNCPAGQHTLRLRSFDPFSQPPADACANGRYGKALDFQVVVDPPGGPCIPHMASWTTDRDFINRVQLNTLDNDNTGGWYGGAYHDYTALSTALNIGEVYTLTIQGGLYDYDEYYAWIDYNDDGDWDDPNEALGSVVIADPMGSGTITFTVPTTTPGSKRMRVRCVSTDSITACADENWGETEDYTVVLQTSTGIAQRDPGTIAVIPMSGESALEVRSGAEWAGAVYSVIDVTGRLLHTGTITSDRQRVRMGDVAAGTYTLVLDNGEHRETRRFHWDRW